MEKFGDLLSEEVPVLTCFYADWDILSTDMIPILQRVSIVMGDEVKILKIDVDKNRKLVKALKIGSLPTIIVYKNMKQIQKWEGLITLEEILIKLKSFK